MCKVFEMSKQALYKREKRKEKDHSEEDIIVEKVKHIKKGLPRTGGRKLKQMLKRKKIYIGRDRLFSILRQNSLLVKRRRNYTVTTNSMHRFKKYKDIFNTLKVVMPEQVFVSDITYIRLKEGFSYLCLTTDAYSRKIMGYALSKDLSRQGVLTALSLAIDNRIYTHPLMHHSDRGFQYCSNDCVELLTKNEISISMTESGSPYDNAIAERINGILKTELGLEKTFDSHEQAGEAVDIAIRRYNKSRIHMSCDYLTPNQAHKTSKPLKRLWKNKQYTNFEKSDEAETGSAEEQPVRNNLTDGNKEAAGKLSAAF